MQRNLCIPDDRISMGNHTHIKVNRINWTTEHSSSDNESQFTYIFAEIWVIHDFEWQRSGTQHDSVFGTEELYHEPMRRTYRKLRRDHPKLKKEFLLRLAVKACKDTLEPERAVPSALVLGELPSLRSLLGHKVSRATLAQRA